MLHKKFHTFEDRTVWPLPGDEPETSLEWRLRYADVDDADSVSVTDRLHAASIVAAYRELINCPVKRRNQVLAGLRAALRRGESR